MANQAKEMKEHPYIDLTSDERVLFVSMLPPENSPYRQAEGEIAVGPRLAHLGEETVPNFDVILVTDKDGKAGTKKIRYIQQCNTIDYEEQLKMGYDAKYRFNSDDKIVITNGILEVVPSRDPMRIKYLMCCNYNASNPHAKVKAMKLFKYNDAKADAKRDFNKTKQADKAVGLVLTLEGNYRKLADVCKLAGIDSNASEEQQLLALRERALLNPETVIAWINSDKMNAELVLVKSEQYGIVEFLKQTKYVYCGTGDMIKGFQGKQNPDVARKKFITFLQSDAGQIHLEAIQRMIEQKEANTENS